MTKSAPLQFDVPSIHCQVCAQTITEAVKKLDPGASVSVDMDSKRVTIGSDGGAHDFAKAIENAGYDVKPAG